MKQPENSIPSFAALALQYNMIAEEQLKKAYSFMEENKTDKAENGKAETDNPDIELNQNRLRSLEETLVYLKILTQYQVNLIHVIRDFFIIRKKSEQFGYIAVQKGYASEEHVRYALTKQQQLFREKKIKKMVGDILVESGVLTQEQQQMIIKEQNLILQEQYTALKELNKNSAKAELKKESQSSQEQEVENKEKIKNIEITVSENKMEAWVKIDKTSLTNNILKLIVIEMIKNELAKKNIVYGILNDAVIKSFLDQKEDSFPIALGSYSSNVFPENLIEIDKLITIPHLSNNAPVVNSNIVKKHKVIAVMPSSKFKLEIKDVFGNTISDAQKISKGVLNNIDLLLRLGEWVVISADDTQILSDQRGYPAVSIDGKFYTFPIVNIHGDADIRFGPVEPYSSLNVAGTLTGAYPVNAGQVRAYEMQDAAVSAVGDIFVDVGINRCKIKTQGSVHAKYIHNSRVEAFGNVVVENEIIDSSIIISGRCDISNGRIIASKISAKKGIIAAKAGSNVTEPSELNAGYEEHIVLQSNAVTKEMLKVQQELDELIEMKKEIEENIKIVFKRMVTLKIAYDNAKTQYLETQAIVKEAILSDSATKDNNYNFNELNKDKDSGNDNNEFSTDKNDAEKDNNNFNTDNNIEDKTTSLLDELKIKMDSTLNTLKRYNQQKKNLEVQLKETKTNILILKPKVENHIMQLELDRNRVIKWAESIEPVPEIIISGKLAEGTKIKGIFSFITIKEELNNIKLVEKQISENPINYGMTIKKIKKLSKSKEAD